MLKPVINSFNSSLNRKLILIMMFLSFVLITVSMFLYTQSEQDLFRELESQTRELTKAIQIGVEEVTASGTTDEARLSNYLKELNAKGVKEISVISNANEIVASTNPSKIGRQVSKTKRELIIKAELGEPVSEEGKAYNIILPVVADEMQYGYLHLKINGEDFSRLLKINLAKKVGATVFVFGIGILTTLILSRQYTRPIRKVAEAAVRVAAGDLNQNVPVQSRDEIGQLAQGFNLMVTKLREARTLEERLRETEHLSGLAQLSRNMAHEIRNPLNFINLSIDHIKEKYRPEDSGSADNFENLIGGMKQEIQRLNKLVDNFLNYSRPLKMSTRKIRVNDLLNDVVSLIWAKADAEGITIVQDYSSDYEIDVDPDLFKSCILNIIGNAFHAMAESGRPGNLAIKTDTIEGKFILTISDNGVGVSEGNLQRIFEPFFSTKQNGLGLGLPMTKKVMEEHQGKVEFNSGQGSGSQVKLILPAQRITEKA